MNAHGISVFHGATNPHIATTEVRPPVGSRVIIGEFSLLRTINLLDVGVLQSVVIEGSLFDTGYMRRLERTKFIEGISGRISRPLMSDDQPLEYLVTQVVADYLASRSTPALDGILYPSVQDGTPGSNVILFHKASRVELMDLPHGTEIDSRTGHLDDDGWETDYHVFEMSPPPEPQNQDRDDNKIRSSSAIFSHEISLKDDYDSRNTTLRLKLESLEVHHVSAAQYDTEVHTVYRTRR